MTYTQVFGGNLVEPADSSYRAVALSANVTLSWPTETNAGSDVASALMNVSASSSGLAITMPDANNASVGRQVTFNNVGANTFAVKDADGAELLSIAPGTAWAIWLTDNSDAAGAWSIVQFGAGTSQAQAAALAGPGLKAISGLLGQSMDVASFNTNYTAGTGDRSKLLVWTGGAGTLALTAAGTVGSDWFTNVRNSGTGALTIDPNASETINGASTLVLNPGDSCVICCDGSAFYTVGLGQATDFAFDYVSISLTGEATPYSLSGAELNRIAYRFSGVLTANMKIIVPDTVQQYWVANDTSGAYTLEIKTAGADGVEVTQGGRAILYCDGSEVVAADTGGLSTPISVSQGGTGADTPGGALINLGGGSAGIAVFEAETAADARAAISAASEDDVLVAIALT